MLVRLGRVIFWTCKWGAAGAAGLLLLTFVVHLLIAADNPGRVIYPGISMQTPGAPERGVAYDPDARRGYMWNQGHWSPSQAAENNSGAIAVYDGVEWVVLPRTQPPRHSKWNNTPMYAVGVVLGLFGCALLFGIGRAALYIFSNE